MNLNYQKEREAMKDLLRMRIRVRKRLEIVKKKFGVTTFKYRGAEITRFTTTRWGDRPYYMFTLGGKKYGTYYRQTDVMDKIDNILDKSNNKE